MGMTGQSVTLANSIIGVGILAMPFCFQKCGVLLATLILLFMGLVSRLCCHFLLKSALIARRRNFEFLAFHVFGPAGKMAVEVGIIGFLMGTCIAYFVVVGDLGPQIIAKIFNINQSDILRTSIMVVVSLVCVLPLGLLRNVDSLSNVSAATIGFYFCLVIKVIAEAASQLVTGDWQSRVEMWKPSGLLQCVPIFSMALFCQTQLFEIFESLPTLSLEKMNQVAKNAIHICAAVYFTLGVFGYIAFSSQEISGNILMSLSPTMGSDVIKLGFVMSLAFSFPLIIFPCRASLYSFLYKKVHSSQHDHIINHSIPVMTFRCITVAIIGVSLCVGLLLPNVELVLGLLGSTIGVLICIVFPAACFIHLTFKNTNERVLAKGVIILGLIILVLGTYANLEAAESQPDRYDDKSITQERIDKIVEDFFQKQDKTDDVYLKPAEKNEAPPKEKHKNRKTIVISGIIPDSEVQPPNPVPPESKEKITHENKIELSKEEKNIVLPPPSPEKMPDTHPKDLKTKLEAKLANDDESNNAVEKPKPKSNEVKADSQKIKENKLIETIKQHGEEQKELIKEQKEILDEIIKTKNELDQNKNEKDPNEAKKLAVESIKQIADIAIKSIGGVTDKPEPIKNENKADRLEKLTNDAVQEIAKKAAETIEAIKDIKEEPEPAVLKLDNQVNNVVNPNVAIDQQANQIPVLSAFQQQIPAAQQQVPAIQQQFPAVPQNVVAQQQVSADQQQNIVAQQQIPASQQNVVAQQHIPAIQQQIPAVPQNVVAQQQVPAAQQQNIIAQQQVPAPQQNIIIGQQQGPAVPQPNIVAQEQNIIPQQPIPAIQQQNIVPQLQVPAVQQQNIVPQQQVAVQQQNIVPQQQVPVQQQNIVPQQQVPVQEQNIVPQQQVPVQQQNIVPQQQVPVQQQNIVPQQQVPVQQQNIVPQQQVLVQQQNIVAQQVPAAQQSNIVAQQQIPAIQQQNIGPQQQVPDQQQNIIAQFTAAQQQIPIVQQQFNNPAQNIAIDPKVETRPYANINPQPSPTEIKRGVNQNAAQNQPQINQDIQDLQQDAIKQHSHMPDEPQSYKQGEDILAKKPAQQNKIAQNVPLPVASSILSSNMKADAASVKSNANNVPSNDDANIPNVIPVRQKREVIDCTQKVHLKPADRQICKSLIYPIKDSQEYLPSKVDMNKLALPKDLAMDFNILNHLSRQLKSYDTDER